MMRHRSKALVLATVALVAGGCDQSDTARPAQPAATPGEPQPAGERHSHDPGDVVGREWKWVRTVTPIEIIESSDPARYTLRLDANGRAVIQFDCNRGGGDYQIEEGKLSFGPLMSTRMACPPDSQDTVFMGELSRISSFFVAGGDLFLEMPMDSGTMRFEAGSEP